MPREFPGIAVGSFADLGGNVTTISAEWVPPPEEVEAALMEVAGYYENISKPILAARAIAREDIKRHFDTETDPDGNPWQPLDDEYIVKKQSQGGDSRILRFGGDLEKAATSSSAFIVNDDSLFYSADGLPFYWRWMQEGTGPGGSRVMGISMAQDRAKSHGATSTMTSHESQGIGRGQDTPARPFIGISADAEEQILEVFDLWFAEGVSIAISGSGIVQSRVGGRFGNKLYPNFM